MKKPNWAYVHTEMQNSQMRELIDMICNRIADEEWASDELLAVATRLQDAAVAYTNALYAELPPEENMVQDGTRTLSRHEMEGIEKGYPL